MAYINVNPQHAEGAPMKQLSFESTISPVCYRVQVGAFKECKDAQTLFSELKQKGFLTTIVFDGGLYKVQVGSFVEKNNAEKHLTYCISSGYKGFVVEILGIYK